MDSRQAEIERILDANLNRAREALRVVEEYARFVCDDAAAAAGAKAMRHELRILMAQLRPEQLLAARDVAGDVGREARTASEQQRDDAEHVAAAALARLSEALRSLGEYGKLVSDQFATGAERLRFRAYELEQVVRLRSRLRQRLRRAGLYVIITEELCRGDWLETAEQALASGAACVQLREKGLSDAELVRRGRRLRELTARHGALLIINDRVDVARLVGADGVHVGQDDLSVAEARRIGGGGLLVGRSTHDVEQLAAAIRDQPDYIAVGPMFPSRTKPQSAVAGLSLLCEARKLTEIPLVAIGGIDASAAGQCIQAGAACVCVCAAVIGARRPGDAAAEIVSAVRAAREGT